MKDKKTISNLHLFKGMGYILLPFFSLLAGNGCGQKGTETHLSLADGSVYIRLNLPEEMQKDSLSLLFYEDCFTTPYTLPHTIIKAEQRGGSNLHEFVIPEVKKPGYITMQRMDARTGLVTDLLTLFLIEPGDRIQARLETSAKNNGRQKSLISFEGQGSVKYNLQQRFLAHRNNYEMQLNLLEKEKERLSGQAYKVLKADIIGTKRYYALRLWGSYLAGGAKADSIIKLVEAQESLDKVADPIAAISKSYVSYVVSKRMLLSRCNKEPDDMEIFNALINDRDGVLKDKLIAYYVQDQRFGISDNIVQLALKELKAPTYYQFVNDLTGAARKGREAFDFSLPDAAGRYISFGDFKGKVVFLDFWFTGCGGCAIYYDKVLSVTETYFDKSKDVVFVSISMDKNKEKWIASLQETKYTSAKAVNLFSDGLGFRHPIVEYYQIRSYPRPILIGKDGRVYSSDVRDLRQGGSDKLIETIKDAIKE